MKPPPGGEKRENPSFTFFADDALSWEPIAWLSDELLGQCFKLVVYGCKLGGALPADHPLLGLLNPKVIELCTVREGDHVLVVRPHDLPRLMSARRRWRESRRPGARAAAAASVRGPAGRFSRHVAADDPAHAGAPAHAGDAPACAGEKPGVLRSPFSVPRSPFFETREGGSNGPNDPSLPSLNGENGNGNDRDEREDLAARLWHEAVMLAGPAGLDPSRLIEVASRIEAGNGHPERSFRDPRSPGLSDAWLTATLRALPGAAAALSRPVPL